MHESSLIADLIAAIERAAIESKATRVLAVELSLGALEPAGEEHLREHFIAAAPGTIVEGAELRITRNLDPLSSGVTLQAVELER